MIRSHCVLAVAVVTLVTFSLPADASKVPPRPERAVVGLSQPITVTPDLSEAIPGVGGKLWSHVVEVDKASFLKPHFVNVNLREGDTIVVRSQTGHVVEEIRGRGPKDMGSFWGLSAMGESYFLELWFTHSYDRPPFAIDQVIVGNEDLFSDPPIDPAESICQPPDFEDAVCYQSDATKWANVMGSVGVMTVGGNPVSALWCSGSNVSPQNYMMTNYHCIESQSECNSSEYVFNYYDTTCGGGTPTTDWAGYRCGTVVASSPFSNNCESTLANLDFNLASVLSGDPATDFGYVSPDPVRLTDGEAIYIVQHPNGRSKEITHGSGQNVDADGTVLRYYDTLDTEPGSSGSPIYRESDGMMVGLHHCGTCTSAGVGNRGMLMADIYPMIEDYVCQPERALAAIPPDGLVEVSGNGNMVVEPGETWEFRAKVKNNSCDATTALGVTADFQLNPASTTEVDLLDTTAAFPDIPVGSAVTATTTTRFSVRSTASCGDQVAIDLVNLTAATGGPYQDALEYVSTTIGEVPVEVLFSEDFTGPFPGSWTVVDGGSGTGAAQTWTNTNPGGRSLGLTEPFAICDSDEHGSGNPMDEELISPVVDCTGYSQVELQFSHDFNAFQSEQCDVEVRSGATGGSWVQVASYSGTDTSGLVTLDISAHAVDQTDVQIRFHYYDADYEYWWAVDDIFLLGNNGYVCGEIFNDSFESGTTDNWSIVRP